MTHGKARARLSRWYGALLCVSVLGGALRFAALDAKTVWLDEAFSLWMARHTLPDLMAWLVYIDHHPPLFYALLHVWVAWFGDGPTALRSLSALAGTLAIPAFGMAARRLVGERVALIATLLLALSPFHVRYAQEARMYGVLVLAVALLCYACAHLLTRPESVRQWRWWLLLATAQAAAMLTHNTATLLVPLAFNVAVLGVWWQGRIGQQAEFPGMAAPHFARRWLLGQVGALLLWSPWSMAFVRQAQVVDSDFWIASPDLWTVWQALGSLTFAHLPDWVPWRDYVAWLALELVTVALWRWRHRPARSTLLMVLWLVPPAVELLVSLRRPIFYDRTLIWVTLPYFLLMARGLTPCRNLRRPFLRGWHGAVLGLVVALNAVGLWGYYHDFAKEDWDLAAHVVAAQATPQDLILFHASWAELPFVYHYPDRAPVLQRHGVPADLFAAGMLEPPMTAAAAARVRTLVAGASRVWLVYAHWWYTDPEGLLLEVLEEELEKVSE